MAFGNPSAEANSLPLGDIVKREVTTLHKFLQTLEQEQRALIAGTMELLPTLAQEKSALAIQLNQFAEQRHQLLRSAALPAGLAGMEAWLTTKNIPKTARQEWQELLKLASQAREINEINGKLINTRMQQNQQTLNALLEANNQATLYGADGQTHASSGGRLFGAA